LLASISCSEALEAIQRGKRIDPEIVRALGEEQPGEFFRIIIEGLSDFFEPDQLAAYEELMRASITAAPAIQPKIPDGPGPLEIRTSA